ncbi:hypothetical protein AB0C95_02900 [Streptomyces caniferus]|uniref:hypothetical protein n=1 Tax=Streptomyces caniferus TaxID=285557 RepID=UPI0033CAC11C
MGELPPEAFRAAAPRAAPAGNVEAAYAALPARGPVSGVVFGCIVHSPVSVAGREAEGRPGLPVNSPGRT